MLAAHDVARIRAAEEAAFALGHDLMARAARGLADVVADRVDPTVPLVVLVGPGNNGGDALFAAVHWCAAGRRVNLCLLDPETVHAAGLDAALAAGARIVDSPDGHAVVVDALFGIGARPGLDDRAAMWAQAAEAADLVVAVDVPSGIGVDDGTLAGPAIRADLTVTFGALKPGLVLPPAAELAGEVVIVDIGLYLDQGAGLEVLEDGDGMLAARVVPTAADHKYSRGVLGVRAGSVEYPGAAHLTVAGALAGPVGMVRFIGERELAGRVIDRAPEVVPAAGRVQAWVVGPGDSGSAAAVQEVLADDVPVVLDAGALTHLPERFTTDVLLTPHAGELAAMLDTDRDSVEAAPLEHVRRAATRWHATVLLKGARTIVAAPDGRTRVNTTGTPWLGTAGAGDVLAGFAGALLAAGLPVFDAAAVAAFVHGRAAETINPGGPITASEVAAELPLALATFLTGGAA